MDCRQCKTRHRADQLIERATEGKVTCEGWSNEQMEQYIKDNGIACPDCGSHDFTPIRQFNLMFKTFQGTTEDSKATIYLRPETAQGMFVDFKSVQRAYRKKLPFGIGQIGSVSCVQGKVGPALIIKSQQIYYITDIYLNKTCFILLTGYLKILLQLA